jgi:hypothetical protein
MDQNEGFGATRRTPRQFTPRFMGFLKFGDNARDNNPFRPVHLRYGLKEPQTALTCAVLGSKPMPVLAARPPSAHGNALAQRGLCLGISA